jgi:hypothetical protein
MTNRREFVIQTGSLTLLGFAIWRSPKAVWQIVAPTAFAQASGPTEFKDLYVRSLGFQDILTATQWQAGQAVTLSSTIEPRSHSHQVIIPAEEIAKLSAGQNVSFQSQLAQGHQHPVSIKLTDAVPGGSVIPNVAQPSTTQPPTTGVGPVPPTSNPVQASGNSFSAILGDDAEPYLYVEAIAPIDSSSIFYCLGDAQSCSRMDWVPMVQVTLIPGRTIYRSKYRLKLRPNDVIHISANSLTGGRTELHAEVTALGSGLFLQNR